MGSEPSPALLHSVAIFVKLLDQWRLREFVLQNREGAIIPLANEPPCPFHFYRNERRFLFGPRPGIGQFIEVFTECRAPVEAVKHVGQERVGQCGIVDGEPLTGQDRLFRVRKIVEKPKPKAAPWDLGIMWRYVLGPEILECLERTPKGIGGEVQLSDALSLRAREGEQLAYISEGNTIDASDTSGLFQLAVELALRDRELAGWLRRRLKAPPF
jgi:UTP-glucose-1-phosphate uridylyltransferase